ncbi:hypothetical protein AtEden1_Chr1g0038841 [Arabidopsis thaliana]
MSSAMDKAMLAMSLQEEEEDQPFDMPDLPEFSSCERNALSLVGRLLNPDCQEMKRLIRDMPRKWQKEGRVKGIALTREKFQFIFKDVLGKGAQTFDEWSIAIDRWYENLPENYLQFIPIWVQIWNLPINNFTVPAIKSLGNLIGQVTEVAFDPERGLLMKRMSALFY